MRGCMWRCMWGLLCLSHLASSWEARPPSVARMLKPMRWARKERRRSIAPQLNSRGWQTGASAHLDCGSCQDGRESQKQRSPHHPTRLFLTWRAQLLLWIFACLYWSVGVGVKISPACLLELRSLAQDQAIHPVQLLLDHVSVYDERAWHSDQLSEHVKQHICLGRPA